MASSLEKICIQYISKNIQAVIPFYKEGFFLEEKLHSKLLEKLLAPNLGVILDDDLISVFIHEGTTTLKMSGASNFVTDKSLVRIGEKCPYLDSISLFNCHNFSEQVAVRAFSNLNDLTFINMAKCSLAVKSVLVTIGKSCPKLQGLILNRNKQVNDEIMAEVLPNLPNLAELSLMGCRVSEKTLDTICKHNPQISILNLSRILLQDEEVLLKTIEVLKGLHTLNLTRLHALSDKTVYHIMQFLPNIERLQLMHCSFTEKAMTALFKVCQNLREVALPSFPDKDKKQVEFFPILAENCPKLELFSLPKVLKYNPDQLGQLAASCTRLKSLFLTRTQITDDAVHNILTHCQFLSELHIAHCQSLTKTAFAGLSGHQNLNLKILDIAAIVQNVLAPEILDDLFSFCSNLRYLDISYTPQMPDKVFHFIHARLRRISTLVCNSCQITDNDFQLIAQCNRIHTLSLQGCEMTFQSLLDLSALPRISSLSVAMCQLKGIDKAKAPSRTNISVFKLIFKGIALNPQMLKILVNTFPTVRYLNVSSNPLIGNDSISLISQNVKNLQHWNMAKNTQITDAPILELPKFCPMVHSLNLAATAISDLAAICVLTKLPLLQTVHFTDTAITDNAIVILETHKTKLQILAISQTKTTAQQIIKIQLFHPFLSIHARHIKDPNFSGKEEDD